MVNILKDDDRENKRRFLEAGTNKWQLILPDKSTIDCLKDLYCNHSGEVSFVALMHIDEVLVDVLFWDSPIELKFCNVRKIDDAVFSKLAKHLAESICYLVKLPEYKFSKANRVELKKRGLTLSKAGDIWNRDNAEHTAGFKFFWNALKDAPKKRNGRCSCPSAGRGSDVRFWFKDGSLNFKAERSNRLNRAQSATKKTAYKWYLKCVGGTSRKVIGKDYSSWFHDLYSHFTRKG